MRFGANQKLKFNSDIGSYSIVTNTEYGDSQITATDSEANLLINFFGKENIHIGNVSSNKTKSAKSFLLHPSGNKINLNLVFPKPNKTELRLYLSSRAGFKPQANTVWFMYIKDESIWIVSMSESEWRNENTIVIYDSSDSSYQDSISELDELKITKLKERDVFSRDRNIAINSIKLSNYKCSYDPSHQVFNSRFTKKPFLEAHHLVPMALQKITGKNHDIIENVFCLCPYCHRAIHNASEDITRKIISKLTKSRPKLLDVMNINTNDIFSFYSVEEIS